MTVVKKKTCIIKFSKGITVSKDFQSVRYDIGIEAPFEMDPLNRIAVREAVEKLEVMVNRELKRRKRVSTGGLQDLDDDAF